MSRPETCRIAATPADYQRYGIAKEIAAWEDGSRTRPGGPGIFEWWYFDAAIMRNGLFTIRDSAPARHLRA